ncbi:hypothetical protein PanWU01x14_165030 [Parasponia andersonii]|uniref:Uncharacterized protein n=1 Tax=Parasponia andersonii TaxID=3476 RepID=A0A2P5CC30_PARAD|nr:hypothetical protein PanWU01x14_165030 [Parasponia andersonii]
MVATPDPVRVGTSERRRDEGKKGTTHGKSRDVVTSLEARESRLESNLGTLGECVDDLDGHSDGLETEDVEIHNDIKDALGGLEANLRREIDFLHSCQGTRSLPKRTQ